MKWFANFTEVCEVSTTGMIRLFDWLLLFIYYSDLNERFSTKI